MGDGVSMDKIVKEISYTILETAKEDVSGTKPRNIKKLLLVHLMSSIPKNSKQIHKLIIDVAKVAKMTKNQPKTLLNPQDFITKLFLQNYHTFIKNNDLLSHIVKQRITR